jgi:RNase P subunit RPR2
MAMLGYCVKCREKREFENPKMVSIKVRGGQRSAVEGTCPVCGTKMVRFVSGSGIEK